MVVLSLLLNKQQPWQSIIMFVIIVKIIVINIQSPGVLLLFCFGNPAKEKKYRWEARQVLHIEGGVPLDYVAVVTASNVVYCHCWLLLLWSLMWLVIVVVVIAALSVGTCFCFCRCCCKLFALRPKTNIIDSQGQPFRTALRWQRSSAHDGSRCLHTKPSTSTEQSRQATRVNQKQQPT